MQHASDIVHLPRGCRIFRTVTSESSRSPVPKPRARVTRSSCLPSRARSSRSRNPELTADHQMGHNPSLSLLCKVFFVSLFVAAIPFLQWQAKHCPIICDFAVLHLAYMLLPRFVLLTCSLTCSRLRGNAGMEPMQCLMSRNRSDRSQAGRCSCPPSYPL